MKVTVPIPTEINLTHIRLELAVRYDEEDIPNDFPLRKGDLWTATVGLDTGRIEGWPQGQSGRLQMKVCDEGTYTLFDAGGRQVARLENDYVPHGVVPGEYGDYVDLEIDETGIIANWPKRPDVSRFFPGAEEE